MVKKFKVSRWFKYKLAMVATALVCFSYLLWYSYYIHIDNTVEEDLPIIKAPINIVSKPEDPGGMIIPNKDKDIYKQMSGRGKANEMVTTTEFKQNNLSKSKALDLINNQLKKWKTTPAVKAEKPVVSEQKVYYVRVAKLKNAGVKDEAIKILQAQYSSLKGLASQVYEEKPGDGQSKYYLHVGPIKQLAAAESLCAKLTQAGKSCKVFSDDK
jgi:hypothetical protein